MSKKPNPTRLDGDKTKCIMEYVVCFFMLQTDWLVLKKGMELFRVSLVHIIVVAKSSEWTHVSVV